MAIPLDTSKHDPVSTSTSPYLRNVVREVNFASKITAALNAPTVKQAWDLVGSVPVTGGLKTLPANVALMPSDGKFVIDPSGKLDIAGKGFHNPLANIAVFEGATAKTLLLYDNPSGASTFLSLSPAGSGLFLSPAHGLSNGDRVLYWTKGEVLGGMTNWTLYYVVQTGTDTFKLSPTLNGSPVLWTLPPSGTGLHFVVKSSVNFTSSTNRPQALSTEVFDTSNSSFNDRLRLADAALMGKHGKIVADVRALDSTVTYLTSNHTLEFSTGDYANNYNGNRDLAPILFCPDTQIQGNGIVTLRESGILNAAWSSPQPRILGCYDFRHDMGRIVIKNLNFTFTTDYANAGNQSTVHVGNASSGYAENLYFNHCTGYCFQIGGFGGGLQENVNYYATDFTFRDSEFRNCPNQPLFVSNALRTMISNVKWYHDDDRYLPQIACDVEPNHPEDLVDGLTFANCEMDYRIADPFKQLNAGIVFNSANTSGIRNVKIQDCHFRAPLGKAIDWITATGVSDISVDNCAFEGAAWRTFNFHNCKKVRISNNDLRKCGGYAVDDPTLAIIAGCPDADVYDNKFPEAEGGVAYRQTIQEYELEVYVDSVSGSVVNLGVTPQGINNGLGQGTYNYPNVWVNEKFELAMAEHTVTASANATRLVTVTPAPAAGIGQKVFAATAINTSTGEITVTGHNLPTGSLVGLVGATFAGGNSTGAAAGQTMPAHAAPAALPIPRQDEPPRYYVINRGTNLIRLAKSREDALAGIFITFTSQGTGNFRIIPILRTKFLRTTFSNNKRAKYLLDPNGQSKILSRGDGDQQAMVVFTSPTVDVNLTEGDTGLIYTDKNKTGTLQMNLPDNPRDGLKYVFIVVGSGIRVACNSKSKIYHQSGVTPFYGQIEATARSAKLSLVSINGFWHAEQNGTWTAGAYNSSPYDVNFSSPSTGSSASASGVFVGDSASRAIDGDFTTWWSSAIAGYTDNGSNYSFSPVHTLDVDFGQDRTITRIEVWSVDVNAGQSGAPTGSETNSPNQVIDFLVQTWDGSQFVTIPSVGTVTNSSTLKKTINFSAITTRKYRIAISKAKSYNVQITETRAFNVAP